MNGSPAQKNPAIIEANDRTLTSFLVPILALLLGILGGFGIAYFLLSPKLATIATVAPEEQLPISLELLQNPIVYEWRGSVKGKLVSIDEHTLTLEDEEGNRITITDITPEGKIFKTIFVDSTSPGGPREVSRSDIPIGATLVGEFWIFKGGKNTPVGGSFSIISR